MLRYLNFFRAPTNLSLSIFVLLQIINITTEKLNITKMKKPVSEGKNFSHYIRNL